VPIRLAAMGLQNALRTDTAALSTAQFFRERPGAQSLPELFIGKRSHGYAWADFKARALPFHALRVWYTLTLQGAKRRNLEKMNQRIGYLNAAFRYFTHHSFDFRPSVNVVPQDFAPLNYLPVINRGIYKHLVKMDETELPLAGAKHHDARSDWRWMREQPQGTIAIRLLAWLFRKTLRRCTSKVTLYSRPRIAVTSISCSPVIYAFSIASWVFRCRILRRPRNSLAFRSLAVF
jgi:alcohol-forming fatty acyl-CoA reductase